MAIFILVRLVSVESASAATMHASYHAEYIEKYYPHFEIPDPDLSVHFAAYDQRESKSKYPQNRVLPYARGHTTT